jgi:lipoprotein NlpI
MKNAVRDIVNGFMAASPFRFSRKTSLIHCPTAPNLIDGRKYMEVSQLLSCCSLNARRRGQLLAERGHLDLDIVLPEIKRLENDSDLAPLVGDAVDNTRVAKIRFPGLNG